MVPTWTCGSGLKKTALMDSMVTNIQLDGCRGCALLPALTPSVKRVRSCVTVGVNRAATLAGWVSWFMDLKLEAQPSPISSVTCKLAPE